MAGLFMYRWNFLFHIREFLNQLSDHNSSGRLYVMKLTSYSCVHFVDYAVNSGAIVTLLRKE
jgi:hypothetical protein